MSNKGHSSREGEEFTTDSDAERTQLLLGTPPQLTASTGGTGSSRGLTEDSTYKELSEEERLRLLLVEGKKETRGVRVTHGAAKILGRWPTYVASAIWAVVFIISLITLLSLLTFMLLVKNQSSNDSVDSLRLNNEFCRRVTSANHSLRVMGYLEGRANPELTLLDASNNIFFLETSPPSKEGACSIESVLRLCPDKVVFVIDLGPTPAAEDDPVHRLRAEYTNLHCLKTGGAQYLSGSPFEGLWGGGAGAGAGGGDALTAAKLLTVWQFGGAVLSDNLILYSRRLFDHNEGYCEVDRELLFCPDQCSAYVYEMIETAVRSKGLSPKELVDRSLENFCGFGNKYVKTGCVGVARLKPYAMCDTLAKHCVFIRIDEFKAKNPDWLKTMKKFCPLIMS